VQRPVSGCRIQNTTNKKPPGLHQAVFSPGPLPAQAGHGTEVRRAPKRISVRERQEQSKRRQQELQEQYGNHQQAQQRHQPGQEPGPGRVPV